MTDEEIQRKFDNVWVELNDWRKFKMKFLILLITGAFLVGGAWVESRLTIKEHTIVLEERASSVAAVPKIQRNQKEIAKGVNYNGQVLRGIAVKVGAELPDRETVDMENGDE